MFDETPQSDFSCFLFILSGEHKNDKDVVIHSVFGDTDGCSFIVSTKGEYTLLPFH